MTMDAMLIKLPKVETIIFGTIELATDHQILANKESGNMANKLWVSGKLLKKIYLRLDATCLDPGILQNDCFLSCLTIQIFIPWPTRACKT
jgi:hypothetical protein